MDFSLEKLTYLEGKILLVIAETHPYSFKECEKVYRRCKSFDETIRRLKLSLALGIDTDAIMHHDYNIGYDAGKKLRTLFNQT